MQGWFCINLGKPCSVRLNDLLGLGAEACGGGGGKAEAVPGLSALCLVAVRSMAFERFAMEKEQVIERLWEVSGHGTRRQDIEAAFQAGALEARVPLAKWDALRAWLERSAKEYASGDGMSIAESIHGASAMREVLSQMAKIERPNV